jgi:hypothetical protein
MMAQRAAELVDMVGSGKRMGKQEVKVFEP